MTMGKGADKSFQQAAFQGGSIAGVINDFNGGSWSRCETACVVLPAGASIKEIKISSRAGVERVSYLASGSNPHDPNSPNVLKYGGVLNAGSMGDFSGYQGLQFNPKSHSVCTTAKNWSGDQPTAQTVRVIFER
ncbi:hypothetical protein [Pseudorhodoferax sp. Leaf274]|uniref:hypothetical protein n=1 Tax=Pseudorhodoferax sp. Leaf274 TaxID=1736318 RepID=UPI0012E1BD60|nr:hypothetical protein [Pseudorhodoferax sp. Leaf274]